MEETTLKPMAFPLRCSAARAVGPSNRHDPPFSFATLFEMTRRKVADHADEITPKSVEFGSGWPRLFFWMFGQYGPWILFVGSTWFLYQDNKALQLQVLEVTKAQIAVNAQVVTGLADNKVELKQGLYEMNRLLAQINEEAKRAHAVTAPK